ncbi:DUF1801 domain-containing protein [Sphingomonas sp. AR_OL41]|jgi:hypothetical protein|uniref:DUF1801 domain-containing protein n=1 Tax=Sphingomonas sp. AR_OL41 TaxID=3042729 RepID=UPI0024814EDF|nr:DUF1801 domain-containing protein [Sphingomonas sp. AR_OL41]MDH7971176.1 DUF1801 domain-containing protein [Sphingomonas sp. AR_OL41]
MTRLFLLEGTTRHDPVVDAWFAADHDAWRAWTRPWFDRMRACGADVEELLHDGHPTACVDGAAFAYVDAFTAHANVGFFYGAFLPDPAALLEGAGKRMRHVKLRSGRPVAEDALGALIVAAYRDIWQRLQPAS